MLERYRGTIEHVRTDLRKQMLRYFVERGLVQGDVPGDSFYDSLQTARLMQADLVLCALRLNTDASLRLAERLVGRPIKRCPPALRFRHAEHVGIRRQGDDRLVTRVRRPREVEKGRRRLLCSPLYDRVGRARVGMSVSALLTRGLRRRDIRVALRRGYLELEAA